MKREKLPGRRSSEIITFRLGEMGRQMKFHATVGYYDAAMTRPGEVFLNAGKIGSEMETVMRDSAIAISFALQHGATIDEIRDALSRETSGAPMGPLGVLVDILMEKVKERRA